MLQVRGYLQISRIIDQKVAALAKDIVQRYNIPPTNVLAHSDIAHGRKQDQDQNSRGKSCMTNTRLECGMMKVYVQASLIS